MAQTVSADVVPSPIPMINCPFCEEGAIIFRTRQGKFIAECDDVENCRDWPQTSEHPTPLEAAEAWNRGEAQ